MVARRSESTSPSHEPHSDTARSQIDGAQTIWVAPLPPCGDRPDVFERVEEAFGEIAIWVKPGMAGRDVVARQRGANKVFQS